MALEEVWVSTGPLTLTGTVVFHNKAPFAAEGIDILVADPGHGAPITKFMTSGCAGYCCVLSTPIQQAVLGVPITYVASYQNTGWEVWAHPDIKSLADLAGKQVARTAPIPRAFLDIALKQQGIDPAAVTEAGYVLMDPGGIADIAAGKFMAACLIAPGTVMAADAGLNRLADLAELGVGDPPSYAVMARDELIANNPDQVRRMIRATLASTAELKGDKEKLMRLIAQQGVQEHLVEPLADETIQRLNPNGDLPEQSQRLWIEISRRLNNITEDIPLSRVFDFSLLDQVMAGR